MDLLGWRKLSGNDFIQSIAEELGKWTSESGLSLAGFYESNLQCGQSVQMLDVQ